MSKKTLLNEATVRQFMKYANIGGLTQGFVNEMYAKEEELEEAMHDEGREDKMEEDLDEGRHDEGREDKMEEAAHDEAMHDEGRGGPPMEEAAHEEDMHAEDMHAEDMHAEEADMDDEMKMDDEAEMEDTSEASVEALVDALADTISRVTGVEVTAADDAPPMDDMADAPMDDAEMAMDDAEMDMDAADEEAADDVLDEEEMIEETVRRVTKRIAAAKKRDQLAETITSRIMERLASKK